MINRDSNIFLRKRCSLCSNKTLPENEPCRSCIKFKDKGVIFKNVNLERNEDISLKENIHQMYEHRYTVEEIAEFLGDGECVQNFRECPKWCHEDADCNDCWEKCLREELES